MPDTSTATLLFATPVILDRLEQPDIDAALERVILQRRDSDAIPGGGASRSWHSDNGLFGWGGKAAVLLLAHVLEVANRHTVIRGDRPDADYEWRAEAWVNVSEPGVPTSARLHPDSYWTAIYCLRMDAGTGGGLILADPRSPAMEKNAHLWFADGGIQREASIATPAGTLILIPSWLRHSIAPWEGDGLRIWIAMNLSVQIS
jgi:hypothetical protein